MLRTVSALLAVGADAAAVNAFGKTPYDVAAVLADQILPEGAGALSSASRLGSYSNLLGHGDAAALRAQVAHAHAGDGASTLFDRLLEFESVDWDAVAERLRLALAASAVQKAAAAPPAAAAR